jgi:endonuclease/exonuclease/phosphatase family metal-dependent hydrolase
MPPARPLGSILLRRRQPRAQPDPEAIASEGRGGFLRFRSPFFRRCLLLGAIVDSQDARFRWTPPQGFQATSKRVHAGRATGGARQTRLRYKEVMESWVRQGVAMLAVLVLGACGGAGRSDGGPPGDGGPGGLDGGEPDGGLADAGLADGGLQDGGPETGADGGGPDGSTPALLRIVTYDLGCYGGPPEVVGGVDRNLARWTARLERLALAVTTRGIDALLLQEVCRADGGDDQASQLARRLSAGGAIWRAFFRETHRAWADRDGGYSEGIAIVTRLGVVGEPQVAMLPTGNDGFPRKALSLEIAGVTSLRRIVVTHLSRGSVAQAEALRSFLQGLSDGAGATILGGNFEVGPLDEPLVALTADRAPWVRPCALVRACAPTYPVSAPREEQDHLLARVPPGTAEDLEVVSVEQAFAETELRASDSGHLALCATLRRAIRPSGAPVVVQMATQNLHGYHALGEEGRVTTGSSGTQALPPDPWYFTWEELTRGNRRRLDALAADLLVLRPDLLLLQEVAAGTPGGPKDCVTFEAAPVADEAGGNTALRLQERLAPVGYSALVACRGNVGWVTQGFTSPIQTPSGRTVFPVGASPYPDGILVEGLALLFGPLWYPVLHRVLRLEHNAEGHRLTAQAAVLAHPVAATVGSPHAWLLVLNIHGGHKLAHFEQAVVLREELDRLLDRLPLGTRAVVGGDINARLLRPERWGNRAWFEVATVPYEVAVAGRFDYGPGRDLTPLRSLLAALNDSQEYKPWATVADAGLRLEAAIDRYRSWLEATPRPAVLRDALTHSPRCDAARGLATAEPAVWLATRAPSCDGAWMIDLLFLGPDLALTNAFILYRDSGERRGATVDTLSDHPMQVASWTVPARLLAE